MGTREGVPLIARAVAARLDVAGFKSEILADGFDYARLAAAEPS